MVKIARLPNPTFGVADLDPRDERLSRVPPRDTDLRNRPPALSKSAGPRSAGVEAMKMRAKYLILAIALLCLLALPSTALAADDNDSSKVDSSVTTVLDATGGSAAVPVIVYTDPGAEAVVEAVAPTGVETTVLAGFDAVAAYLTEAEIDRSPRAGPSISSSRTTRSSGSTTRAPWTSPIWRSAWTRSGRPHKRLAAT